MRSVVPAAAIGRWWWSASNKADIESSSCSSTRISDNRTTRLRGNTIKINPFFSGIYQLHKMYEKVAIILQIWHRQMIFYKHKQCMVLDTCTKYEENHHILFLDITTQNVWKNCRNYSNLADIFYFRCISGLWYVIMAPNMKKIHPAIMEEYESTDWPHSYIPQFHPSRSSGEQLSLGKNMLWRTMW